MVQSRVFYYSLPLCFRIANFVVFCITAATSVLAYVWLAFVLVISSPGKIDVWEAVLTFLFFPATVWTAYVAERRMFCYKYMSKSYRAGKTHNPHVVTKYILY